MLRRFALLGSLALTAVVGCASSSPDDQNTESSSDAVRTATCPQTISVKVDALAMRTFFAELHTPADYNAMKDAAQDIGARGEIGFDGQLKSKARGRCNYADGATNAVLYTKGGKDILRVDLKTTFNNVYLFTFPSAYAPDLAYSSAASQSAKFVAPLSSAPADPADDVDASEAASPFWVSLGTGKASAGAAGSVTGLVLQNGADITRDDRPDALRVIAPVGGATGKVTDSSLANCEVEKNDALSTSTRTVFDITLDYEIDDGWNGCTFELSAPGGYKSTLTAGFSVDD